MVRTSKRFFRDQSKSMTELLHGRGQTAELWVAAKPATMLSFDEDGLSIYKLEQEVRRVDPRLVARPVHRFGQSGAARQTR